MPMPDDLPESMMKIMGALMQITLLMPLVGLVERTGGLLFIFPGYRAPGAIIVLPVTIGILLTNIFSAPSGLPIAAVLLAINLRAIVENWPKYLPMIQWSRAENNANNASTHAATEPAYRNN